MPPRTTVEGPKGVCVPHETCPCHGPPCLRQAFFWVHGNGTANDTIVEYAVVHSGTWFTGGGARVQAIAMHWNGGELNFTRTNLVTPLYCSADAPAAVLNCSEWGAGDLPRPSAPTTLQNFTATRSADPRSIRYQSLNPLTGRVLLKEQEMQSFIGGLMYVVLYTEEDAVPRQRIRGRVQRATQPSCIGGLVFEVFWGPCPPPPPVPVPTPTPHAPCRCPLAPCPLSPPYVSGRVASRAQGHVASGFGMGSRTPRVQGLTSVLW